MTTNTTSAVPGTPSACHPIEIFQIRGGNDGSENTFDHGLVNVNDVETACSQSPLSLVFCSANEIRKCTTGCFTPLSTAFSIPPLFWTQHLRRANGYVGYENVYGTSGKLTAHLTWFRFIVKQVLERQPPGHHNDYTWKKINIFTQWLVSPSTSSQFQARIIIFDAEDWLRTALPGLVLEHLTNPGEQLVDPYWFHATMMEKLVEIHDDAVWGIRDRIRYFEKNRPDPLNPKPNYPKLHEDARHAIHVYETAELAEQDTSSIIQHHRLFLNLVKDGSVSSLIPSNDAFRAFIRTWEKLDSRLCFSNNFLGSLKARSKSNTERLRNEINLAFNTVAQHDSRISVNLSKAATMDSSAMRTIAFVTLAFLPATLVAAIFSTGFFNFSFDEPGPGETLRVSKKFWVFWAIAGPLTAFTILVWFAWHKIFVSERLWNPTPQDSPHRPLKRPTIFHARPTFSGFA